PTDAPVIRPQAMIVAANSPDPGGSDVPLARAVVDGFAGSAFAEPGLAPAGGDVGACDLAAVSGAAPPGAAPPGAAPPGAAPSGLASSSFDRAVPIDEPAACSTFSAARLTSSSGSASSRFRPSTLSGSWILTRSDVSSAEISSSAAVM